MEFCCLDMTSTSKKLVSRDEAINALKDLKSAGKIIGYTSGVFDILHPGHIAYLEEARKHCDVLIVGVNSDSSVKQFKGAARPITPHGSRAAVVAGLLSVDYVFIFEERNNNRNVELLKPDCYLKAGDYDRTALSSGALVEEFGGKVVIIPFQEGHSSSAVIDKILSAHGAQFAAAEEAPVHPRKPAIFVDRDGTINEHVAQLHEPQSFKIFPGALEALKRLKDAGYYIIVVTNQPGIGLGYFSKEDFFKVNTVLLKAATAQKLSLDKIYFCPHSDAENCACRKPKVGMVERAKHELNIDIEHSFVVGDMTLDVQLAKNAGCMSVLVATGRGGDDKLCAGEADFKARDLAHAAEIILQQPPKKKAAEIFPPAAGETAALNLQSVGRAAGKIGHDINNILGPIRCATDMLRGKLDVLYKNENPFAWQFDIVSASVDRARQLAVSLRSLAQTAPLSLSRVSLKECAEAVKKMLTASAALPASIEIVCEAEPSVVADESMVAQVLLSICLNSLDAMEIFEDRMIIIHVSELQIKSSAEHELAAGKYARVSVIDHGVGISEKAKKRLFEPFFSTKSTNVGKGMGLGLTMAHEIMKKLGGSLSVRSEENRGTVVNLYFPAAN